MGASILGTVQACLDDHMGPCWERAFRQHLRQQAAAGALGDAVAVGPFWTAGADPHEIDAVVLAGCGRVPTLVGEAKWSRTVDAWRIVPDLRNKATALPSSDRELTHAVCAREQVRNAEGLDVAFRAYTAEDLFG